MHEGFYATFRAQLALPDQRHFFDYWLSKKRGEVIPSRAAISPADIPRFLPNVSLIEMRQKPLDFFYRLAGTRLREYFSAELTGMAISQFPENSNRTYWRSAFERVAETGRPAQGVLRGPEESRDHLVQFWLRLPLGDEDGNTIMILGHDVCVPVSRTGHSSEVLAAISDS